MTDVLYDLAKENPAWKDAAISRYADFVAAAPADRQVEYYGKGLATEPSEGVCNKILRALANTASLPAVAVAAPYLEKPATSEAAAYAVVCTVWVVVAFVVYAQRKRLIVNPIASFVAKLFVGPEKTDHHVHEHR